jgi:hypothetical protein
MEFNDKVVDQIVEKVVAKLAEQHIEGHQAENPSENRPGQGDGVFQDMGICINAAVSAQKELLNAPVEDRRRFIQAIRETGMAKAEEYGRMEFEETGLGKADDNMAKVRSACNVPGMEDLTPEVYAGDKGVTIIERLPIGVIASVNPVTNGAPTIIFNAIMMMSGGNRTCHSGFEPCHRKGRGTAKLHLLSGRTNGALRTGADDPSRRRHDCGNRRPWSG